MEHDTFKFPGGILADLVDMLEPRHDRRDSIELRLQELATRYWRTLRQRKNEPSRAAERQNLALVEQRAQDLLDAICNAGSDVEWLLAHRLRATTEEELTVAEALQQLKERWLGLSEQPRGCVKWIADR